MSLPLVPLIDTGEAGGEGTPLERPTGITRRMAEPGYFPDSHNAPRRKYTITLSGEAEIGVGDGTLRERRLGICCRRKVWPAKDNELG